MARTPAQAKALETKALAASSKSEGMRSLFEAGYTVAEVRTIFGVPYGFAYGVARRAGVEGATSAREAKPKAEKPAVKKAAKPAAAKAAPAAKTAPRKATTRKVAAAKA